MRINEIAAEIHRRMCEDERFGYSWEERYGAYPETWTIDGKEYVIDVGDYDCSSSTITAWKLALQHTSYAGALEGATYTGNMASVFTGSGLFEWKPMSFTAQTGDLYLNEQCHVAMCQSPDPDLLSEFSGNEYGGAYGGQRGDQTGWESHITGYYSYPWDCILHYNGAADASYEPEPEPEPEQKPGKPVNKAGLWYRAHVQDLGWCEAVHDGQTAGTVGFKKQMEALKVTPPEGWVLDIALHISNVGWKHYKGIQKDVKDPVMGTTGKGQAIEDVLISVAKRPEGDKRKLYFKVHQAGTGWKDWTKEGFSSGSDGLSIPLEAIKMKVV